MIRKATPAAQVAHAPHAPGPSDFERDLLLRAIEAALDVHDRAQFEAWIEGGLGLLVPHAALAGVELDRQGAVRHAECLHAGPDGEGLAVVQARQLAAAFHAFAELPPTAAARQVGHGGHGGASEPVLPGGGDILLHRARLVSGAALYFVFFDVPQHAEARCRHHLRLLSSHLKMAWTRVFGLPAAGIVVPDGAQGGPITAREREILDWMRQGKSNQEISQILGISPLTLKAHVRKIYRKLDVADREAAVARGLGPALATCTARATGSARPGSAAARD